MIVKAATPKTEIKIGQDYIEVSQVKGDNKLARVVINKTFAGYIELKDGTYKQSAGSKINELIFAKICGHLEVM